MINRPDIVRPACGSTHWMTVDCAVAPGDDGVPPAMYCVCATAWDPRTGRELDDPSQPCALMFRRRAALTDEERERFARLFATFFSRLGMDLNQPGTKDTPLRFVDTMADLTGGYEGDPKIEVVFPKECRASCGPDQIVEAAIPFFALREHHVLPFYGRAVVGYLRNDLIIGLSKLTRIVRLAATRFTQQERMGQHIVELLEAVVKPAGVAVVLEAQHMCSQMRGIHDPVSRTRTIVWRGRYQTDETLQRVFLHLAGQARLTPVLT